MCGYSIFAKSLKFIERLLPQKLICTFMSNDVLPCQMGGRLFLYNISRNRQTRRFLRKDKRTSSHCKLHYTT
nr:MAG TPA: hypothetical protein [Caudoviricetes sp.]